MSQSIPVAFIHAAAGWSTEPFDAGRPVPAAVCHALGWPGLLTDALARVHETPVTVRRLAHRPFEDPAFGAGKRRDVLIEAGTAVRVTASTLMPAAVLGAHPWLAELGSRALGETLARHCPALGRGAYEFRTVPPALAPEHAGGAVRVWARRYRFVFVEGALVVMEVFSEPVLAALGEGLRERAPVR